MPEGTRKASAPLCFKIHGMDCAEEVASLRHEVGPVVGGDWNLAFDVLNGRMIVTIPNADFPALSIVRAVERTGMRAEIWKEASAAPTPGQGRLRDGRTIATVASGVFLLGGFVGHAILAGLGTALGLAEGRGAHAVPALAVPFYALGIASGAWFILPKAWVALRRLRPDMNLLMTIAVLGAAGIGEWFEAATVAFLFAVSLSLESWSVARARRAIAALMALTPPTVIVLREDGKEETVPSDRVPVGGRFLVRPGERIALDGNVVRGSGEVNQAPITGESTQVHKAVGAQVFAGTVNGDGVLEVESTRPATDTVVARIVRMVEEAGARRAPSEMWVDRFARVYTPAVMILAVGVLVIPPLLFGGLWQEWLYRALVLLVIGCPCALVISTPVSIVSALAAASRNGVLVKGGAFIEAPAHLRAIAIDKTGTLTTGTPGVATVVSMNGHTEAEILALAAAIELRSEHPLAAAIVAYARERGVTFAPAQDVAVLRGKGATGVIDGTRYWIGSHRYADERGQGDTGLCERLDAMATAGGTIVVVGNDEHVCGLIGLRDAVRPGTRAVLDELRAAGIRKIVMLTGDNQGTASVVGAETGVDEVRAELLPEDKVTAVESLVAELGWVAMVGDGVNDAPAMARATVGIAMGAVGSDAAIESADIALMSDDLAKLPWLVCHSRRTLTIIRQNIGFSLSVKVLFTVLTFVGAASLWGAIAADMGASLLVVFNGLRLLREQRP
jgi:Cd2+/Zn2+-exporting ATPase